METKRSLYLEAIQSVTGSTPGEKYETLNRTARKIVALSHGQRDTIRIQLESKVPEVLIPIVKLEIDKILRQPDGIIVALTSDDNFIFQRALQTKWFLDGSIENVTNINYFQDRIFSRISIKNRHKLIAKLSIHLAANKKNIIAEEFHVTLSDLYGVKVSEPFLLACSESFIWRTIISRQLVLSERIVGQLYVKYPDIIVKYLQLSKPNDEPYKRNLHVIPIHNYRYFLPRLLNKHVNIFIDLMEMQHVVEERLSRKCTDKFLKYGTNNLIQKPNEYAPILNLKSITSKLTKEQFGSFFRNLFPKNKPGRYSEFSFINMYKYLEYYPNDEKVSLILSTYEEVYNERFLDRDNLVTPVILRFFSPEDRLKVARKRLEGDPSGHSNYSKESWMSFLPTSEAIPIIKNEINKTSKADLRAVLLKHLIHACKINNDEDALLKVLEYIETRHRNEPGIMLLEVIGTLLNEFQMQNLSKHHWKRLDNIIQSLHTKNQLLSKFHIAEKLIIAQIHYKLVNKLSITGTVEFLVNFRVMNWARHRIYDWNLLKDYPEYERKCLEEFCNILPYLSMKDDTKLQFMNCVLIAINYFNERILCTENKIEPIKIENYSQFSAEISQLVNNDNNDIVELRNNLQMHNLDLYYAWVKRKYQMINLKTIKEFNLWIKNPDKIKIHWDKFSSECQNVIHRKYVQRFIKNCRWYQDLPIEFAEKCFRGVIHTQNRKALIVLALLYEGSAFQRVIYLFCQIGLSIDVDTEIGAKNYSVTKSLPIALPFVNPPVSLNVTSDYCNEQLIHFLGNWVQVLALKTPIDKLIPFVSRFMDQPVSISKHFIRIFLKVANINQLYMELQTLWRTDEHITIRTLVFDKIFNFFVTNPSHQTWLLLNECFDGLTNDDKDQLRKIGCLDKIPNEYIVEYVKKLFTILRKFQSWNKKFSRELIFSHITKFLKLESNIGVLFPEELHQEILKTYFADMSLPYYVLQAAQYYLINAYINPSMEKLESRLNFYSELFIDILKNQWDIPDPQEPNVYPANYMIDTMMIKILSYIKDNNIRKQFVDVTLNSFRSVLSPLQAPVFYSYYSFASLYCGDGMSRDEYVKEIGKILPALIDTFSVGFISELGKILNECLELLWNNIDSRVQVSIDIIEGLVKLNIEHAISLAVAILMLKGFQQKNDERYRNLFQILRKQKNPVAIAHASMQINSQFDIDKVTDIYHMSSNVFILQSYKAS